MDKVEMPKIEMSAEAVREVYKERTTYMKDILGYKLPKTLNDVSNPITFGEKKKLESFDLKNIDELNDEDFDKLLEELLTLRGVDENTLDKLEFSDLQMWVRRVVLTSFDPKAIVTKK